MNRIWCFCTGHRGLFHCKIVQSTMFKTEERVLNWNCPIGVFDRSEINQLLDSGGFGKANNTARGILGMWENRETRQRSYKALYLLR